MSSDVIVKLAAIVAIIALGFVAGRTARLGGAEPARTLSNVAFYLFTPALLFRTTARIDLARLPWATLAAFFGPVVLLMLVVYAWQHTRVDLPPAGPSVRAISTTFGNTVQLGIPVAAALFGEAGLAVHVTIVSLHALTLLTIVTVLVELDLARAHARTRPGSGGLATTVAVTARNTVIHPVMLPVLAGLAWNVTGLPIPAVVDEVLRTLAQAVVPVCLVTIGMSLAHYGLRGVAGGAVALSAGKLVLQPALVLVAAHWGAGLHGMPLAVVVMCAALPIGSNALLFAQRYEALEGEATAGIVVSTVAYVVTAPVWLTILDRVAP